MANEHKLGLKELIAIGVGGMVGGGIFSVMGLAVGITGNATPLAFLLGGLLAFIAGYSYIRLAVSYKGDGASFTYLELAFPNHPFIGSITGWTVIAGYIGTMALYAFTFGAYGAELLGPENGHPARPFLSAGVLLVFMIINLYGTKSSGSTEDLIVYSKIILLGLLAIAGFSSFELENTMPLLEKGISSVFMAAALIFVAYEGFQLITNTVLETENPDQNIPRGIYGSILIVTLLYLLLSLVALGSLPEAELIAAKEYALAVAAEPSLGNTGRILTSIAALLATSSAINATLFGASRMMAEMATENEMPKAFSFRNRETVPWIAVVTMTILTLALSWLGSLEFIAAFSSMTFLVVSLGVSIANLKLRQITKPKLYIVIPGCILLFTTIVTLLVYLAAHSPDSLLWMVGLYSIVLITEQLFKNFKWR